jgi:predicted NBD/HSP70 family sugar kinase
MRRTESGGAAVDATHRPALVAHRVASGVGAPTGHRVARPTGQNQDMPATPDDAPPTTGSRHDQLRRHNLSLILTYLHRHGATDRAELTRITGLTRSTVATLVAELADLGLVRQDNPLHPPARGRPSLVVHPRDDAPAVLALEVNVDSIVAAIIALGGRIREHRRIDRTRDRLSPAATLADAVGIVRPLLQRHRDTCVGIGVAVAGMVDRNSGTVLMAPNLGWRDVAFAADLRDALGGTLPVLLGNEADLGAFAEHSRGSASHLHDFVYLSGEVGVGAGIFVGGRPMIGNSGHAGEVGHMVVNPWGRWCRCGGTGCWETEVGEQALLRHAGVDPTGGRPAVDDLITRADLGEATALAAIGDIGRWLGIGLASLTSIFSPQAIILDGLFGRLHPHVQPSLEAAFLRHALAPSRNGVQVRPSTLRGTATLHGAAELALGGILNDPAPAFGRTPTHR